MPWPRRQPTARFESSWSFSLRLRCRLRHLTSILPGCRRAHNVDYGDDAELLFERGTQSIRSRRPFRGMGSARYSPGQPKHGAAAMAQSQVMTKQSTGGIEALSELKDVAAVRAAPGGHWVGDGFPVRTVFGYDNAEAVSPFLLLDYAGPFQFAPADKRRGVGEHPHRGFETVTILYSGEVEHRDSSGGGGKIGPGEGPWMTAGFDLGD